MIKASNITAEYKNGNTTQMLFMNETFSISEGDFVIIIGPSGSGKSTLLKILSGNQKPTSGDIYWSDKNIYSLNNKDLSTFKLEDSGFIYQDFMLIEELNVYDNISLVQHLIGKTDKKRIDDIIKMLELELLLDKYPKILSGGEKQRVAIGRALANNPKVLFCDEPTGSLDHVSTKKIMEILKDLNENHNITIILVTHELENLVYGTKFIKFNNGKLECD